MKHIGNVAYQMCYILHTCSVDSEKSDPIQSTIRQRCFLVEKMCIKHWFLPFDRHQGKKKNMNGKLAVGISQVECDDTEPLINPFVHHLELNGTYEKIKVSFKHSKIEFKPLFTKFVSNIKIDWECLAVGCIPVKTLNKKTVIGNAAVVPLLVVQ